MQSGGIPQGIAFIQKLQSDFVLVLFEVSGDDVGGSI
jgi:hypothetical protein